MYRLFPARSGHRSESGHGMAKLQLAQIKLGQWHTFLLFQLMQDARQTGHLAWGLRNINRKFTAQICISRVAIGDDCIQTICRAALDDEDKTAVSICAGKGDVRRCKSKRASGCKVTQKI